MALFKKSRGKGSVGASMSSIEYRRKREERKPNQLTKTLLKSRFGLTDAMIKLLPKSAKQGKYYSEAVVIRWVKKYKAEHPEEWQAMMERAAAYSANHAEGQYGQQRIK